ncbi:raffinose/stachyose/melibiose transport system substrate-binding protein [Pseudobutyrivibrio sp. YE44]|uniref:ABC transporter substrate-binding protein n=1 Tax=Pseudobutyrivibrio sp. YE44 TaxID=1520802 RepID=UPI0008835D12|nr:ABC transporter substrate-binding protein [Pseudobutyrivibrio sp. YE44]SDB25289.1 raffinose/stachyose/melibiose transport system substrate-binding protein [Pseudobutyrivibrio sp. YE44]
MRRRLFALMVAGLMALSLVGCGGGDGASGSDGSGSSGNSIRLVNGKIEVDSQLKKLAEMYEKETGVHVEIESMGGGIDIQGELKAYYQSDNMPDIFVCGGEADFNNWVGNLQDMSDQAWVSDTDAAYVSDEGTIGFPYTTEAVGLAYNADILEKAGVDPASITSPAALKSAFETIDSKKDELGLTAVIGYFAEPVNLYWSTGNHLFGTYLDEGLARDDTTYIDMLNDGGKLDDARFAKFADMVELFNEYADQSLLVSGTYDQQILNFASGKYAFVTQGSWIGATMTTDDKDAYEAAGSFKCGMAPYAFDDGIDTILTNSPSWWAVYKDGNVEEAEKFLQWLTTDPAQEVLVMEAGFISPYKSCSYVANDPFAQTISDYTAAGKTSAWHWLNMTDGYAQNYTGQVFADFASGSIDKAKFIEIFKQVTEQAYAQ